MTAIDVERVNARGLRLGAVTAHGPPYLREGHGVPEEEVESALERARRGAEALEARLELETLPLAGRTTVVVDDGLITGLTLAAACRWARAEEVARLIAATPVGQMDGLARLRKEADLVVCPHPLEEIAVVGQAYDIFADESWFENLVHYVREQRCQAILQLGDLGYWPRIRHYDDFLRSLPRQLEGADLDLYFVEGNHEDLDALFDTEFPQVGPFRKIEARVYHLPRGAQWRWRGLRFVSVGGG